MKFISEKIFINDVAFTLRIPDPVETEQAYKRAQTKDPETPFPYWTRLWPSAIALTGFILENPHLVEQKKVLEMGAGLGLPSIASSGFAERVTWSDYLPEAMAWMKENIRLQNITNMECRLLDFSGAYEVVDTDVLLLSDISYDPTLFPHVSMLISGFLQKNGTILLATPPRLTAAAFIDRIQRYISHREEKTVVYDERETEISLFVLKVSE